MRAFVKTLDWLATIFGLIALSFFLAGEAQAITLPSFPSCTQPLGTVIANYETGIHGIVGDPRTFSGSDRVFQVSDNTLIQCFCPQDVGIGIQTNWMTAGSFSENDQDFLLRSGWQWVQSGAAWGLKNEAYLAKNNAYTCHDGGVGGGDVLGSSSGSYPQVLGLADTGLFQDYLFLFSLQLTLLIAAYFSLETRHLI